MYKKGMLPSYPDYTQEMYDGNEPVCVESTGTYRGYYKWITRYGSAYTDMDDNLFCGIFSINPYIHIWIYENELTIQEATKNTYNSKKVFSNTNFNNNIISDDDVIKIINTKIPCKLWEIVKKRAHGLFVNYKANKKYKTYLEREKDD